MMKSFSKGLTKGIMDRTALIANCLAFLSSVFLIAYLSENGLVKP